MTILTNTNTFTIFGAAPTTETVTVAVLPLVGGVTGKGSLTHPIFGKLSYPSPPDEWVNIDTDVIVPPSWGYAQTLGGGVNTLHPGSIKDVVCEERWISDVSVQMPFLRTLLNYWMNPPAPEDGYIIWQPTYTTEFMYHVVLSEITVNGDRITLDYITRQGWVAGVLNVKLRIIGYA